MGALYSKSMCKFPDFPGPPISADELQTGDLLLFVGGTGVLSHAIEMGTQSPFTHCAIVVRDPRWTTPKLYGLYAWESSSNSFADAENHRFKMGVQMSTLDRRVQEAEKWGKRVYVRQLSCERGNSFESRLARTHSAVHNLPYDSSVGDWLKALCIELGIPQFSTQSFIQGPGCKRVANIPAAPNFSYNSADGGCPAMSFCTISGRTCSS